MTIQEAVDFNELYSNDSYIPRKTGITIQEFDRIKLIAWNDLNLFCSNRVENTPEDKISDFEKSQIKFFMYSFIDGWTTHEDQIITKLGVESGKSLGDYSSGSIDLKGIDPSNYQTYPFYSVSKAGILRTNLPNTNVNGIFSRNGNTFIW